MSNQLPRLAGTSLFKAFQQQTNTFAANTMTTAFRTTTPQSAQVKLPREPIMNRARRGLFHGKHIMFGNNVAHSERKSRRTWMPNIQKKRFQSELLDKQIHINVTTKALKTMDKYGGFDNYMLKTRVEFLGGEKSVGAKLQQKMQAAYELKKQESALKKIEAEMDAKFRAAQERILAQIQKKKAEMPQEQYENVVKQVETAAL